MASSSSPTTPSRPSAPSRRSVLAGGAAAASAAAFTLGSAPVASAATYTPDQGILPERGDNRYKVTHYYIGDTVDRSTDPERTYVHDATTMTCVAMANLSSIQIDFALNASSTATVTVGGRSFKAPLTRHRSDRFNRAYTLSGLSIPAGAAFTVRIGYDGFPVYAANGAWATDGLLTDSGRISLYGEPNGASYWYPCNEWLQSKARYTISLSVPLNDRVMGPGIMQQHYNFPAVNPTKTNYLFVLDQPVHAWAVGIHVGSLPQANSAKDNPSYLSLSNGQRIWSTFIGPSEAQRNSLRTYTKNAMEFITRHYTPYPSARAGGVMIPASQANFYELGAQEVVGSPVYPPYTYQNNWYMAGYAAHETAHMWFGNHVTAKSWRDILLIQEAPATLIQHDFNNWYGGSYSFSYTPTRNTACLNPTSEQQIMAYASYQNVLKLMLELRTAMEGSSSFKPAGVMTRFLQAFLQQYGGKNADRTQFRALAVAYAGNRAAAVHAHFNSYGVS